MKISKNVHGQNKTRVSDTGRKHFPQSVKLGEKRHLNVLRNKYFTRFLPFQLEFNDAESCSKEQEKLLQI